MSASSLSPTSPGRDASGVTDTRGLALVETNTSSGASSYLDYRDYRDGLKRLGAVAIGRITR